MNCNKWTRQLSLAVILGLVLAMSACTGGNQATTPEQLFAVHCGSCHQAPDPGALTKEVWSKRVLPEMGARLGIQTPGYQPLRKASLHEAHIIRYMNVYPETPLLPLEQWEAISQYILSQAPDTLEALPDLNAAPLEELFLAEKTSLDFVEGGVMTYLDVQENGSILSGNVYGYLLNWSADAGVSIVDQVETPLMWYNHTDQLQVLTEVGIMPPSEEIRGMMRITRGKQTMMIDSLHRPVFTLTEDLNDDGKEELVVCEYGNYSGRMMLIQLLDNRIIKTPLYDLPGVLKVEATDLNGDGRKDLVFMAAQGEEGMYALYQENDLSFRLERLARFSPISGASWFDLVDYDGDGDLDLLTAHGDNADYSPIPKPYHGIRILLNEGGEFVEQFFYPLYGATRIIGRDFDEDGDMDLAVASFFPAEGPISEQSFVYLENTDSEAFQFSPYTTPLAASGRWLVMDAGDLDGDGDEDIVLGSMLTLPGMATTDDAGKQPERPDMLILRNRMKSSEE